jgi:hypothetical protein
MLTIHLEKAWCQTHQRQIGPVDGLRIVRRSLRVLPLNVEVLRLSGDQWRNEHDAFAALVIDSLTLVYGERCRRVKGRFYGPFERIRLAHGTIQTMKGGRRTLARFNPIESVWHVFDDQSDWPTVIFFPCSKENMRQ